MSLKTGEPVHCVEFSPFQHSAGLVAIGGRTGVTVKSCSLQVHAYTHQHSFYSPSFIQAHATL